MITSPIGASHRGKRPLWKRLTFGLISTAVLFIVGTVVTNYLQTRAAKTSLETTLASLRTAGEPVEIGDLVVTPSVADAQNAAVAYRKAFALLDTEGDAWQWLERPAASPIRLPLRDDERGRLIAVTDAARSAGVFDHVATATERTRVDWQIPLTSPATYTFKPPWKEERSLARLLCYDAIRACDGGRFDDAAVRVEQVERLADAVAMHPGLISMLVSTGIHAMAAHAANELAAAMITASRNTNDGRISSATAAATDDALRKLIARFADDASVDAQFVNGLRTERVFMHDMCASFAEGNFGPATARETQVNPTGWQRWFSSGRMFIDTDEISMRWMTELIAVARATDVATRDAARSRADKLESEMRGEKRYVLASILAPSLARSLETHRHLITERHIAAAALACAGHARAHGGELPATLGQLVGNWIAAVPSDRTSKIDGTPIRYRADRASPILWTAGENGVDDGGQATDPNAPARQRQATSDNVVHLTVQPRPTVANED